MKAFLKRYWWLIILGIFVVALPPFLVEIGITKIPGNGSDDGWLGFWGSYLGIIPSGLIAYGVARYQIVKDQQAKRKESIMSSLPYFSITNFDLERNFQMDRNSVGTAKVGLIISSINNYLPFLEVKLILITQEQKRVVLMGNILPNRDVKKISVFFLDTSLGENIKRIDISCRTVQGTKIFFSYDLKVNGMHAFQDDRGNWHWYVNNADSDENEANKRIHKMYPKN